MSFKVESLSYQTLLGAKVLKWLQSTMFCIWLKLFFSFFKKM